MVATRGVFLAPGGDGPGAQVQWSTAAAASAPDYGYEKGAQLISRDGHSLFTNRLIPLRAVLGGTAVEYADALIPTSSSSSPGAR